MKAEAVKKSVADYYGNIAKEGDGCCDDSCCGETDRKSTSVAIGYSEKDLENVPADSNLGLGCGNPNAIAALKSGEAVLDLGSGGGLDCFLAARAVGPEGRVFGVDMTPEMIFKARANAEKGGYSNVSFLLGEIERIPLPDNTVDTVISNCVINLSPDKQAVYGEAFRVLKPGGRLAISDMVATAEIPENLKDDPELYCGCVSGAVTIDVVKDILTAVGFEKIRVEPKSGRDTQDGCSGNLPVVSAEIEAVKPL